MMKEYIFYVIGKCYDLDVKGFCHVWAENPDWARHTIETGLNNKIGVVKYTLEYIVCIENSKSDLVHAQYRLEFSGNPAS